MPKTQGQIFLEIYPGYNKVFGYAVIIKHANLLTCFGKTDVKSFCKNLSVQIFLVKTIYAFYPL